MTNGKIIRADDGFVEMAKEMAKVNDMSMRQVTKEIAKMMKNKSMNKDKILKEIKF